MISQQMFAYCLDHVEIPNKKIPKNCRFYAVWSKICALENQRVLQDMI